MSSLVPRRHAQRRWKRPVGRKAFAVPLRPSGALCAAQPRAEDLSLPELADANLPNCRDGFPEPPLALTVWFLAIYLIGQAKTGLSTLALKRHLGVSYPTAWRIQHKLMQAMTERDAQYTRCGEVLVDDADVGGERVGGKAGRGSENKVPFVAAVSLQTEGHPLYTNMTPVAGFTCNALTDGAKAALAPGCQVIADGFACLSGVTAAGCYPPAILVGLRTPHQVPEFGWVNTLLGHLKTRFSGAYHAFNFAKYGSRYLAAFASRFNRRFHRDTLPARLLVAAAAIGPRPARWLRQAEESC